MSELTNDPKIQHFLSAVYLRGFCNNAGKLHLYDLVKNEFRSNVRPDKIAKKRHIYTITHNGSKDYSIETFFHELEAQYGSLIKIIENGKIEQLSKEVLEELIWFISFLYARNLSKVNRFSEISEEFLSSMGESLLNHNLREKKEEFLRPLIQIKPNKNYVQKWAMNTMFKVADTMFKLLSNEGKWIFGLAEAPLEFITTDDPMENKVMIPLSKKVLFMRVTEKIDGLDNRFFYAAPEWVSDVNRRIAATANRYIYASREEAIADSYFRKKV